MNKCSSRWFSRNAVKDYLLCGEAYYTPEVSRKIDIIMKKFHESKLLLHPLAAGELSFEKIVA